MYKIILAIILIPTLMIKPDTKATLVYVGDPMCSWCYGFSNELTDVVKGLDDNIEFEIVMGGLRPYNTETMAEMADFLKGHWEDVESMSGLKFSYDILEEKEFVYDTEPPSRAILAVRKMNPKVELAFFKDVQKAFYLESKNTNDINTYLELAKKYDLNTTRFKTLFESDDLKNEIKQDFLRAEQLGVSGFPTMVLVQNGEATVIANGYTSADNILAKVAKALK